MTPMAPVTEARLKELLREWQGMETANPILRKKVIRALWQSLYFARTYTQPRARVVMDNLRVAFDNPIGRAEKPLPGSYDHNGDYPEGV